jgi:hypothetical protein
MCGVRFRGCLSLRKAAWIPGEKAQNPNNRETGIETPNQKQLLMHKSQCRNMKRQDNSSLSKANSTTKDLKQLHRRRNIKYWIPRNNYKNDKWAQRKDIKASVHPSQRI